MSNAVADKATNTVTHSGRTFFMRPLNENSFTVIENGVQMGRILEVFGSAQGVAEHESVTEDMLTEIGEAWFATIAE